MKRPDFAGNMTKENATNQELEPNNQENEKEEEEQDPEPEHYEDMVDGAILGVMGDEEGNESG